LLKPLLHKLFSIVFPQALAQRWGFAFMRTWNFVTREA